MNRCQSPRLAQAASRHAFAAASLVAIALSVTPTFAQTATPAPAVTAAPASGPQPKLVIGDLTFNAGDVAKGHVIEHDFAVKNEGKSDLMILSVAPACGCTAPDWTKLIPPGGSGKITLKVDTAKFKGPISKTATVTTNDPAQATFRLTVNATVKTFIDLTPQDRASFRQYRGEDKDQVITIHSNEPGEFKITDVKVTGDGIKHDLTKATDGTGDYKLKVWLDKAAPIGAVNGSIELITNSGKEPKVTVSVNGTILGQLSVNPSSLYFRVDTGAVAGKLWVPTTDNLNVRKTGDAKGESVGKVSKDTRLTLVEQAGDWAKVSTDSVPPIEGWVSKKFIVEAPAAAAGGAGTADQTKVVSLTHRLETANFQITGVTVEGQKIDPKAIKIETEPVRAGQSYRLTVTYTGKLDKGNYTGTIVIKTTDKEEPEVKIPVYIVVA